MGILSHHLRAFQKQTQIKKWPVTPQLSDIFPGYKMLLKRTRRARAAIQAAARVSCEQLTDRLLLRTPVYVLLTIN